MSEMIRVRYHADIDHIKKIEKGDWIDLRAAEDVEMKKGEIRYISLGVSMQLPEGFEAIIAPRSSTAKTFGITCVNSIGIIDNSYCGDDDVWSFQAMAIRDTVIPKNSRICQFRLIRNQPALFFKTVDKLPGENRGGFGSTGKE